jgi:hypothetical protein
MDKRKTGDRRFADFIASRENRYMIATAEEKDLTIADLVHRLGDISIDRIMLHPAPGLATEDDVIRYLEAPQKRLCELIDGVLVEKPMGVKEGLLGSRLANTDVCSLLAVSLDPVFMECGRSKGGTNSLCREGAPSPVT